jgi:hypothetical protein
MQELNLPEDQMRGIVCHSGSSSDLMQPALDTKDFEDDDALPQWSPRLSGCGFRKFHTGSETQRVEGISFPIRSQDQRTLNQVQVAWVWVAQGNTG